MAALAPILNPPFCSMLIPFNSATRLKLMMASGASFSIFIFVNTLVPPTIIRARLPYFPSKAIASSNVIGSW